LIRPFDIYLWGAESPEGETGALPRRSEQAEGEKIRRRSLLLVTAFVFFGFLVPSQTAVAQENAGVQQEPPQLAAVQFSVSEELLRSRERFETAAAEMLEAASMDAGNSGDRAPKFVVLPEYVNAFPALIPLLPMLREAGSWEAGFEQLRSREGPGAVRRFFLERAPELRRWMDRFYGGWAREHRAWLLAGTYFAAEDGELRNRAVLYGPGGRAVYEQDKVYLTSFEREKLQLSPGEIEEAEVFSAAGIRIAVTICRDSFFEAWEASFEEADVWIDIKANGQQWSEENRRLFDKALPERIAGGEVPWGLTVTLVGELFGLVWEGPSSLVHREADAPEGVIRPWTAESPREGVVKVLSLPPRPAMQ